VLPTISERVKYLERLLTAEPWVEREVQHPLSGCNLGVVGGARRSNHTLTQGWANSVLEGHCPAQFSFNPDKTHRTVVF